MEKAEILGEIQNKIVNFRDLNLHNQSYVKPNMIFRSSSPIPHQSPELIEEFKDLGISSIIDLRSAVEIGYASYNDDFIQAFTYYWVHIDISMPPEILEESGINILPFYKQFCWYTLFHNKNQLKRTFNILSQSENYSIILHCHAGRDRTGIISALVLLLLNAPEANIIQDYLATDIYTQSEDMEYIFQQVYEQGGIEKYLLGCGIEQGMLENIREKLKP